MSQIVGWFSCGNNSAVMSKLLLDQYPNDDVRIVRCVVDNEHPDNDRFHADVERWIGRPIERRASTEFKDCWEVWETRKYLSGIKGAPCTGAMKKAVRHEFEREWWPDFQAFGFSADEGQRAVKFKNNNPEIRLINPLAKAGITKPECALLVSGAGIALPTMYGLGFANNNCICCVKATSIVYWARCRFYFPEQFQRMAVLSRRLGCRLTRLKGVRIFIDEIPADFDWHKKDRSRAIECGVGCGESRSDSRG